VSMVTYHQRHGGQKLVSEWQSYDGPNKVFKPEDNGKNVDMHDRIDRLIGRGG